MSETPAVAEIAASPRPRRREWLLRAAFEGTLILLGLLAAFALDEWQDARTREARVATLMTAIRAELEANLATQGDAAAYNKEVAESLWSQGNAGVTFVPDGTFKRGLLIQTRLTSAAWMTAQNDSAIGDVPVEKLLLLASVYDEQEEYAADVNRLLDNFYRAFLQATPGARLDGVSDPLRIGGLLREQASDGARLVETYKAALEQL